MLEVNTTRSRGWTGWVDLIAPEQWAVYERVIQEAGRRSIPFAMAGGFATATHTGLWRDTNDMDLYILPGDRERMIQLAEGIGLRDMESEASYDHSWTYRATDGHVIVEAIWAMRNHLAEIDSEWIERAIEVEIRGMRIRVTAPEEIIWPKLYVLMRERCDWPDILNYLYYCAGGLDWQHLMDRLGEDKPLLSAVLSVFSWVSPDRISTVPRWVWQSLGLRMPEPDSADEDLRHASLLSTRRWYGPMANGRPLEKSR